MNEDKKIELPTKEEPKEEVYLIPEIGSDASSTGRTIIYKRGELSERWQLLKKAAETDQERLDIADTELRSLKREQVTYNKEKKAFMDDYGNIYQQGKEVNDKNNYVRAKATVILNENKITIPNYIDKFMFSKSRDWKEEPIDENKNDWVTALSQDEIERQEQKKQKAKKALEQIKKIETPIKTENKTDQELFHPLTRAEQIKRHVESLPKPSVRQIIENRAAIINRYSGIGSLPFKEPEFELQRPSKPTSTGLNYLSGLDDEIT